MTSLTAGQTSQYILAPGGARVTLSGSGYIKWAPAGSERDAQEGKLTFTDWPLGSTAGFCDLMKPVVLQVVATGDCSYSVEDGRGVGSDEEMFWVSAESGDDDPVMPVTAYVDPLSGGITKIAVVTQAQYDALVAAGTVDATTEYNIVDA